MAYNETELDPILKDTIKINAVIAIELIQLVENSSKHLRGDLPVACKIQHGVSKKRACGNCRKMASEL